MKIVDSVSSINGRAIVVSGGQKDHREAFINDLFKQDYSKVVLDSREKHITVEQIREFIQSSQYSSIHSQTLTAYIIYGAERLSAVVQNTLLKTLEEVPQGKTFILETVSVESLLTTVQSRVFVVSLESGDEESLNVAEWRGYSLSQLFSLAEEYAESAEKAQSLLKGLLQFVRKEQYAVGIQLQTINYAEFLLHNFALIGSTNTSVRLILENSLLSFYSLFGKGH